LALAMPGASTVALYRQQENADMAKTPTSPKQPVAKGGVPTPPGAKKVPGSVYEARLKGAPHSKPIEIGRDFVAHPRGSAPLVIGNKGHVHIAGDKHREKR
jgi:hypothetical protein